MRGKIVVGVAAAFVTFACGPPPTSVSQSTSLEARIVYELLRDNSRLFSILPDGTGRVALTTPKNHVYDSNPTLSPDGSIVVFTRSKDGGTDLFAVGIDGEGLRRLTTGKRNDDEPVWSPDGTRILWVKGGTRRSRLMVMDANGSGKLTLVAEGDISGPSWSPDGSRIAFARSRPRGIYDDDTENLRCRRRRDPYSTPDDKPSL